MRRGFGVALLVWLAAGVAHSELPVETVGRVERLSTPPDPHWALVADVVLRRSALLDLDDGTFLGMISTGYLSTSVLVPGDGGELYVPETFYSRGSRGERSDVVTIYDAGSLAPTGEVEIPPKRAINVLAGANAALSDDDRFLAIFNSTPATSLSIVDVRERRFAGEIATPGCSLVYAAGDRRFLMLCADGSLLLVSVDDRGARRALLRSDPFFDPGADPVTEKAVRQGDRWLFVSFEGLVHPVSLATEPPGLEETWSLLGDEDRGDDWRIGGSQHLAVHRASGRLYSLMHRGGPDTHKEPGIEIWVYDLATRSRVQRIELSHPGLSFMSETIEFGRGWVWPFHHLFDFVLDHLAPNPGIDVLQVTQDAAPLLVTGSRIGGSVAVYDALDGEFLRRVASGNLTTHALQTPFGRNGGAP